MKISVSPELSADPVLGPSLDRANEVFGSLFGRVEQPPEATWRPTSLKHTTPAAELELKDEDDFVARDFTVDQMVDSRAFRRAVLALWGDLIMLAYGRSSERLLEALRDLRREEEAAERTLQEA